MTGSVVKKGNRWYVVIEGRDPGTGKRKRVWHSGFKTRKEAEAGRIELVSRVHHGSYVTPNAESIDEFFAAWLPTKEPTVRASTFDSYSRIVDRYIVPRIGGIRLQSLTPLQVNSFYASLLADGGRSGASLSPKTVRNVHVVLRKALGDAVRWGLAWQNAAANADPPRPRQHPNSKMQTWSAQQLNAFLEGLAEEEHPLHALFSVAATTGMRRGELLGLRWRDIDFEATTLSIAQTIVSVAYKPQFSTPKTKGGNRVIALDRRTTRLLRELRARQNSIRLVAGALWTDHDLVFAADDGQPLVPDLVSDAFTRRVLGSGLPRIMLHDLRHTHATLALQAGIHPKIVSERLGHSSISVTLDTYSHVIPAMKTDIADVIAGMIFESQSVEDR